MKVDEVLLKKLDTLLEEVNRILATGRPEPEMVYEPSGYLTQVRRQPREQPKYTGRTIIDCPDGLSRFATSSLSILHSFTGGDGSVFYKEFKKEWEKIKPQDTVYAEEIRILKGVIESAKREISEGFLLPLEARVAAGVYSELLESVQEKFEKKEYREAAILEGAVLEEGLKHIANLYKVPLMKKKPVEITHDLVKAGVIIEYEKKKIEQWTEIHNKAEHEPEEFKKILKRNKRDVEQMPLEVKKFLGKYLSPS